MVRPDQDAAGRLLEGSSDRSPRGMTIRTRSNLSDRTRLTGCTEPASRDVPLREAGYHSGTMRRHTLTFRVAALGALLANCSPGVQAIPPTQGPIATDVKSATDASTARYLRLSVGLYRYRLTGNTHIQPQETGDTVPGIVRSEALVSVRVVGSNTDSSLTALVSVDSIRISREGPVVPPSTTPVVRLDSVLRVIFTPQGNTTEVLLTDSLCAYSEFVTIAQDLVLPKIPNEINLPTNGSYGDTLTIRGCRAGITIETVTVRKLRNSQRIPVELALQEQSIVQGSGLIRRDSLTVTGSVSTAGTVIFPAGDRLPLHVNSKSDGLITVRLGSKQNVFRQTSTLNLQRDSATVY